jgi:hypothetical protein
MQQEMLISKVGTIFCLQATTICPVGAVCTFSQTTRLCPPDYPFGASCITQLHMTRQGAEVGSELE